MSERPKTVPVETMKCPFCGTPKDPGELLCPRCGFTLEAGSGLTPTGVTPRNPSLGTHTSPQGGVLEKDMMVVFQFLPSGSCMSYALEKPLVMGRQTPRSMDDFLDLGEFQADHHGVSRQHCRLWQVYSHVLIMDLGSTNGTYLNGRRLIPRLAYVVRHNSRLILGSLHVSVTFSSG